MSESDPGIRSVPVKVEIIDKDGKCVSEREEEWLGVKLNIGGGTHPQVFGRIHRMWIRVLHLLGLEGF